VWGVLTLVEPDSWAHAAVVGKSGAQVSHQVTFRLADETGEPSLAGRQITFRGTPASVNSGQARARGSPARMMAAARTPSRHGSDSG
jgi:hypothetical protein